MEAETHARQLASAALALQSDVDFERSVRFNQEGLDLNRFLIGFDAHILSEVDLAALCDSIDMPPDLRTRAVAEFDSPSSVLLGFEQAAGDLRYKLYLEFWDHVRDQVSRGVGSDAPILLNLGFKWDLADPARHDVTRYTCHPLLDVNRIIGRLAAIMDAVDAAAGLRCRDIILKAAKMQARPTFVYMEAEEENERRSFDLNLYRGNLELGHIEEELEGIRETFGLPVDALAPLQRFKYKTLGHLSGGIDRAGRPFVTIYFEDDLPD